MATYGTIYRMEFRDKENLLWRVDFRLKNAGDTETPLMLAYGGSSPVVIEWENSDEDVFSPIIQSKASITYYINSDVDPLPETFINIEEDEWLIDISKLVDNSTAVLFWRGFVKPDNNTYPWVPMPYAFTINAVDFTFSKGKVIDLNDENLFLYDFITIGDFIKRTLFHSIGYDDGIVKVLFSIKPAVIGSSIITDSLYLHTDAFYDFTSGPKFAYDALVQFLSSCDCRMFYSSGAYWIQRVQDIGSNPQSVVTMTPNNPGGDESVNHDISLALGNGVSDDIFYLNKSQTLTVNAAIKRQRVKYPYQGINQLVNFDWRDFTSVVPDGWTGGTGMSITRVGGGTLEDPYRLRIPTNDIGTLTIMYQGIPITSGKRVQLQMKVEGHYASSIGIGVQIGQASTAQYVLDQSGKWLDHDGTNLIFPLSISSSNTGSVDIKSDPIPNDISDFTAYVYISKSYPVEDVPSGENVYVDVYPVFFRRFNNEYIAVQEDIVNAKTYSLNPPDKEKFFLDTNDDGLSNTIYYDNGLGKVPIPMLNWGGKTIDETVLRGELDQQSKPSYSFSGDVYSNDLSFHHVISLTDFNNKKMMLIRDKYDVMSCIHSIYATEIMPIGSGIGTYTVTPLMKKEDD